MIEKMKSLAREKDICVLATDADGKPYCSLMAYVTDEACREIYMVTHKQTRKYQNLVKNPVASLLIDSRENAPRRRVAALTIEGSFHHIEEKAKLTRVKEMLLKAHPHLADFLSHEDAVILCIKIGSFLLLNGIDEAHYQQV